MRVALIDGDYLPFVACYNKEGEDIKSLKSHVDFLIKSILIKTEATHYILALTCGKCFRYNIYPQYKANRKKLEKPKYFDEIKDYLITKWKAIYHLDLEADDIVNILNKEIMSSDGDSMAYESFIVSPDKDILNLEGKHFNPKKMEWVKVSTQEAEEYFWKSMIIGDTADNIKGIPGKGKVFAEKLIDLHSSLEKAIYDDFICYQETVFLEYLKYFGQELGIEEFYKNYKCLKIKSKYDGFSIPTPIKFELNEFTETDNRREEIKED